MPTIPHALAGQTMLPSVSVPTASGARPAATATPDPELEPDGLRPVPCGLTACPPSVLHPLVEWLERKFAHSDRLALPRITAPAVAQPGDQEGLVLVGLGEGGRTGRGGHPRHGDVVLDQHRDAGQRPGRRAARTGLVAGPRLGGGVRAEADDRVQRRVEPLDPAGVESCQFRGGEGAIGEGLPQRRDRRGVRIEPGPAERLAYLRRCAGLGHARRITAWMYLSARWPPSRR